MSFRLTSNPFVGMQKGWKDAHHAELLVCTDGSDERLPGIFLSASGLIDKKIQVKSLRTYYDTQEGKFFKGGLRLYSAGGEDRWVLVGKDGSIAEEGGAKRASGREGGSKLKSALKSRLIPLLAVEIDETGYQVTMGNDSCELIVQKTAFVAAGGKRRRKGPVYISFGPSPTGSIDAAMALLTEQCGAVRIAGDMLFNGLVSLGLPLPGTVLSDFFTVRQGESVRRGMGKIVMHQTYRIWANAGGTIGNLDPEYLHDMRVATRRLRSAFRFIRNYFDEYYCEHVKSELAWIADLLGKVRDMDVFIADLGKSITALNLPEGPAAAIMNAAEALHGTDRRTLVRAIRSKRFAELMDRLAHFGTHAFLKTPGDGGDLEDAARSILGRSLRRSVRAMDRTAANPGDDALHRLRLSLKRLRYYSEFFSPIFGGRIKEVIKRIVDYQDCLGEHQDSIAAIERLKSIFFSIPQKEKDTGAGVGIAALVDHYKERIAHTREEFIRMRTDFASVSDLLTSIVEGSGIPVPEGRDNGKENNSQRN